MALVRRSRNALTGGVFLLAILFALGGCGGGGGGGNGNDNGNGNGNGIATASDFRTLRYIDQPGIGIEAFQMIVPQDWKFSGGITWRFENPGAPAVANFSLKAPEGRAELQLLPAQPFFSTDDPVVLGMFPVGSTYYGNEVRQWPPLGPRETLKQIIIPRFRSGVDDLRIVEEKSLADVADLLRVGLQPLPGTTIAAAMVRIEYTQNGIKMEEEIYCVVETSTFQLFMGDSALWMADYLFSFKAEKGMLDPQYKLFQTMMYSFRLNPQWFNKYVQLIDYLVKNELQAIQNWAQLSQIISQTTDEIDSMVWQSYNNRNAASDRMAENFSNYIRGTDTYYNPILDSTVKLPSGSSNVWGNPLGEYILSDDVNFNPNVGSTQNWQLLDLLSTSTRRSVTQTLYPSADAASSHPVEGLHNGTEYFFAVTASRGRMEGPASEEVAATPQAGPRLIAERYLLSAPDAATVVDVTTALEWQRCALGQAWDGAGCTGSAGAYNLAEAQQAAAAFNRSRPPEESEWRVPEIEELQGLVYCSSGVPAYFPEGADTRCWGSHGIPALEPTVFPSGSAAGGWFWSASTHTDGYAWGLDFDRGTVHPYQVFAFSGVRLMRPAASDPAGSDQHKPLFHNN